MHERPGHCSIINAAARAGTQLVGPGGEGGMDGGFCCRPVL